MVSLQHSSDAFNMTEDSQDLSREEMMRLTAAYPLKIAKMPYLGIAYKSRAQLISEVQLFSFISADSF